MPVFIYHYPIMLGYPDNYIEGDPYGTPAHIVPDYEVGIMSLGIYRLL